MLNIEELLRGGETVEITPQGNSMHPLFESGRDRVTIEPVREVDGTVTSTPSPLAKPGDVVLYRRPHEGILVLHRVYKRVRTDESYSYYMIGDNQLEVEGPLGEECILGVMTSFVRKGRFHTVNNLWYRMFFGLWRVMTPIRGGVIKFSKIFRKSC